MELHIYDPADGYVPRVLDMDFSGNRKIEKNLDHIIINFSPGKNEIVQYKSTDLVYGCYDFFELKATVVFSEGFVFAENTEKLPVGLYGGGAATCISGGCPRGLRDGFSVRLIENNSKVGLYTYDAVPGDIGNKKEYGRIVFSDFYLADNREYNFTLTYVLVDGVGNIYLFEGGELILSENVYFSDELGGFCPKGIFMTSMWGGDISKSKNWVPRKQYLRLSNVEVLIK